MNKKIVGILIFMLFIVTGFGQIIRGNSFSDQLDQYQLSYNHLGTFNNFTGAQSFKPTLPMLTRVELYLQLIGDPQSDITVSIKEELEGIVFTSITTNANSIPNDFYDWVEFDFPDIQVIPEKEYIIVFNEENGIGRDNYIFWPDNSNDWEYYRGMSWLKWDNKWSENSADYTFKTYGSGGNQEENIIDSISGGFQVGAHIKNNGVETVYNVTWSIDVEASIGLILSGSHTEDVIDELTAGGSVTIQSDGLRGIGFITISVQVADAVKQATAFLLGPLVLRVVDI